MHDVNHSQVHIPVLPDEVLHYLAPQRGQRYLDVTAGYGGHASKVAELTQDYSAMCLVDRDAHAIRALQPLAQKGATLIKADYASASQHLSQEGERFDLILADLGVSSPHLDNANRGFSLKDEAPLDMRMDNDQKLSAMDLVNTSREADLADTIWRYGEEPKSRQIARLIVRNRPIKTTTELASIVAKAWPGHSKVHPATRTFQALRIAVNSELEQLEQALPLWVEMLNPGGRLVVISFHSLEDRIVKRFLSDNSGGYDAPLELLTKKPVTASDQELVFNPRARSAKLRAAAKINNKEREAINAYSG